MKHTYTGIEIEAILEDSFGMADWSRFVQLLHWTADKSGNGQAVSEAVNDLITFLVVQQATAAARIKKVDKIEEDAKYLDEILQSLS